MLSVPPSSAVADLPNPPAVTPLTRVGGGGEADNTHEDRIRSSLGRHKFNRGLLIIIHILWGAGSFADIPVLFYTY